MATVYLTLARAGDRDLNVYSGPVRGETITSSGTSAQGALLAYTGDVATIHCASAVYATVGVNPTATPAAGYHVPAGIEKNIALKENDIVAVIDV